MTPRGEILSASSCFAVSRKSFFCFSHNRPMVVRGSGEKSFCGVGMKDYHLKKQPVVVGIPGCLRVYVFCAFEEVSFRGTVSLFF